MFLQCVYSLSILNCLVLTLEVLKEKSDHVTLRQCEVKSYKNANEEEERRQFEVSMHGCMVNKI